jgi:hypothetical protein
MSGFLELLLYICEFEPGQVPAAEIIPGSEANFTWADLKRLKGKLVMAADSAWVPSVIGDNIIRIIKYVLDPRNAKDGLPLCQGINIQDLYHAHISTPTGTKKPEEFETKRKNFDPKYDAELEKIAPYLSGTANIPTPAERQAIRQLDANSLPDFKALVELVVQNFPRAGMIYHPYEEFMPAGMTTGNPNRNIILPFSGTTPSFGAYLSTDPELASNYGAVLTIYFLVSPKGEIFLRPYDSSLKALEFTAA